MDNTNVILISLVVLLLCCESKANSIRCQSFKKGIGLRISGFQSLKEYNSIECPRKSVKLLLYTNCKARNVELDIELLKDRYPPLKMISWNCEGGCTFEGVIGVDVAGSCHAKGKPTFLTLLQFYTYFYREN